MASREAAGLIGPTLASVSVTEAFNIHVFENQLAPLVYLNGAILFVVGLASVRAHNRWSWTWPTVITVTGWLLLLGGLYRMIASEAPQVKANAAMYMIFAVMVIIGLFLSFRAYGPEAAPTGKG